MATNEAASNFANQQGAAAAQYKDAWAQDLVGGAGQFGGSGPFAGAQGSLSMAAPNAQPIQSIASTMMQQKPAPEAVGTGAMNALPTTPTGATSSDPVANAVETVSNFSSAKPYVADVTDAGDVGRQAERPDRVALDDSMTPDEQYRTAWQNEANGYYGDKMLSPPPPPEPAPEVAPAPEAPRYMVYRTTMGDGIGGRTVVVDKDTRKTMHTFVDDGSGGPAGLMEGLDGSGQIGVNKLKELTGWEYDPNKWNPYTEQNVFRNYKPPVAATPSAAAPTGPNTGEFS